MRLFVSIDIPEDIKNKINLIQSSLRESFANAKWDKASNLHITLKFLGETDEKRIDGIITALTNAVKPFSSFEVSLAKIGTFPNVQNPRVLCLGIEPGYGTLSRLSLNIENNLSIIGFKKEEKPFKAHITLARFIFPEKAGMLPAGGHEAGEVFKFKVEKIGLIQSTLLKNGPVYKCLKYVSIL